MKDRLLSLQLPAETEVVSGFVSDEKLETVAPDELEGKQRDDLRASKSTKGEEFDPLVHLSPPRQTAKGYWKRKRGKGNAGTAPSAIPDIEPNAVYRREAERMAALYASSLPFLLGPDAGPKNKKDYAMLAEAWFQYMIERGPVVISPVPALLIAHTTYTMEVIATRAGPRARLKKLIKAVREKFYKLRGKKMLRKKDEGEEFEVLDKEGQPVADDAPPAVDDPRRVVPGPGPGI